MNKYILGLSVLRTMNAIQLPIGDDAVAGDCGGRMTTIIPHATQLLHIALSEK